MDKRQRNRLETAKDLLCTVLDSASHEEASTFDMMSLARALCRKCGIRPGQLPDFPGISQPWRVLLLLYVAEVDGAKITVTDLALLSETPQTTNLRVLSFLVGQGLIQRVADPMDKRRVYLTLTDEARVQVLEVLMEFSAQVASASHVPGLVR